MTFETSSRLGSQHFALLRLGAKGPQRFGCCIVGVFEARPWRRPGVFGVTGGAALAWPGRPRLCGAGREEGQEGRQ